MKIATFNINDVNKRLGNLIGWLRAEKPDVVALRAAWRSIGSTAGRAWHRRAECRGAHPAIRQSRRAAESGTLRQAGRGSQALPWTRKRRRSRRRPRPGARL